MCSCPQGRSLIRKICCFGNVRTSGKAGKCWEILEKVEKTLTCPCWRLLDVGCLFLVPSGCGDLILHNIDGKCL